MAFKIEVLTAEDAAKKYKSVYPTNKLLGLIKRIDRLLTLVDAPVAVRIHSVKRSAAIQRGKKVEVEYFVDKEIEKLAREL